MPNTWRGILLAVALIAIAVAIGVALSGYWPCC